jgi:uncharacterized membrane protein
LTPKSSLIAAAATTTVITRINGATWVQTENELSFGDK